MIRSSPATAKRRRAETAVIKQVRPRVEERDGFCRIACKGAGSCRGFSEWAHFGDKQRFKTRRMPPDERHTTEGSFMACTHHHEMYDQGLIDLKPVEPTVGCNGNLRVLLGSVVVHEETDHDD